MTLSLFGLLYFLFASINPEHCELGSAFADDYPNFRFICEENRAYFEGEAQSLDEVYILQEIVIASQGRIEDRTRLSEKLTEEILQNLNSVASQNNIKAKFSKSGGEIYLQSPVSNKEWEFLKSHYARLRKKEKLVAVKTKTPKSNIFLELAFVEIRKEAVEKLGLRFGSPIEFGTSVYLNKIKTPRDLIQVRGGNPVGSLLDLLLREGQGRIHFKQSVVGEDRRKARFQVGGEFSLRLSSENFSQLGKIVYGIELEFTPSILSSEKIHLNLEARIREPDLSSGIDGLPLIQTKLLKTQLTSTLDETMAIGGFLRSQGSRSRQSLPLLGEIPLFGRLFTSKDYLQNRSEAYLFITPRVLKQSWRPNFEAN